MQTDTPLLPKASHRLAALIDAVPLTALALVIALWWLGWPGVANSDGEVPPLKVIEADSAEQLEGIFSQAGYVWPSRQVPAVALQGFPDDLAEREPDARKDLFFRAVLPLVLAENARIREQRARLLEALNDPFMSASRRKIMLSQLADEYGIEGDPLADENIEALKQQVDQVPVALALAQAAKESGWGTSRFVLEGNNIFGQWTWESNRGLKPEDRATGARHYVRTFESLRHSVRSYMRNLNTHPAYERFRFLRDAARTNGKRLSPESMTVGLDSYSERGKAYVEEVQAMIRNNQLHWVVTGAQLVREPARLAAY
jgi:Bax protein